jgi:hypothetical protein
VRGMGEMVREGEEGLQRCGLQSRGGRGSGEVTGERARRKREEGGGGREFGMEGEIAGVWKGRRNV